MIPNNIELPDDVLRELTSNPILLRWLASIQSQLVTSTIEENGVGCTRIIWNNTGSAIDSLEFVDADSGLELSYFDASGVLSVSAISITGKWIASSGGIPVGVAREMTRIA